jgi:hypothetical protein
MMQEIAPEIRTRKKWAMSGDKIEAITESAKAVREVAKVGGKAIDAGREAGGWLNRIFGKGIEDAVGLHWSDRITARRIEAAIYNWERLVELLNKVERRLKDKGITAIHAVPPKIALPIIENATIEDDDDLHTLWANLLSTALDASAEQVHKKYVSTLAELTGQDALLLLEIYDEWTKVDKTKLFEHSTLKYGPSVDGIASHDAVSIISLNRLGLIFPAFTEFETYEPGWHDNRYGELGPYRDRVRMYGDLEVVTITAFGEAFCKAVL